MNDKDFEKLKNDIKEAKKKEEQLQKLYFRETGKRFVWFI